MSQPATLSGIVRALGGDLYAGGRRASVPGPGHSAADRSVSLLLAGRRVVVHCFAGDDWRDVLEDLRRRGLVDDAGRIAGAGGAPRPAPEGPGRVARIGTARGLWAQSRPLAGTLSERHLRLRGIGGELPAALRHHPGVPAAVYAERGPRRPALLAAIHDAEGALQGVEVTYLAPNGERARLATPRKIIGACPAGAAVRLAPAGPLMLVGEGVVTCLSAAAIFGLPPWALLSTSNLRRWRPPAGVRRVLIAADRGADGERSARELAGSLRAARVATAVRWPPAPHGDWNEAAFGAAAEEEGGREGGGRGGRMVRAAGPEPRPMTPDQGVPLFPDDLRAQLLANGAAERQGDPVPLLKLFNPVGPGCWLITEMAADGDILFGLCDLDMGFPELGYVSLAEITSVRLPIGFAIERDRHFAGRVPLSRWAEIARQTGSIRDAEHLVRQLPDPAG